MKRWIAMLLTVCMLISLCPVGVFAEPATGGTEPAQTVQTEQSATGATGVEPAANPVAVPKTEKPTNPVAETKAAEPTAETKATEPTMETKVTEPEADGTEPKTTEPAESTGETKPTESTEPTEETTEPTDATGATEETEASEPTDEETENTEPDADPEDCICEYLCKQGEPNAECPYCKDREDLTECKGKIEEAVEPTEEVKAPEQVALEVSIQVTNLDGGEIELGSNLRLTALVANAEGLELNYLWQYSTDGENWEYIDCFTRDYDFVLDETNNTYYWQAIVTAGNGGIALMSLDGEDGSTTDVHGYGEASYSPLNIAVQAQEYSTFHDQNGKIIKSSWGNPNPVWGTAGEQIDPSITSRMQGKLSFLSERYIFKGWADHETEVGGDVLSGEQIVYGKDYYAVLDYVTGNVSALFYFLKTPNADKEDNSGSAWGTALPQLGTIDLNGLTWNGINAHVNGGHVVNWPADAMADNVPGRIKKNTVAWREIVDQYLSSLPNGVTESDITYIQLTPYKISYNHNQVGSQPYHMDCTVTIVCQKSGTVRFYVVRPDETVYLAKGQNVLFDANGHYRVESAESFITADVWQNIHTLETADGKVYTLKNDWHVGSLSGDTVEFPYTVSGNTDFYAEYEELKNGYTVRYLEKDTNKPLLDDRSVSNVSYGTYIEEAVAIVGYTPDAARKSVSITRDDDQAREIIFYYTARTDLGYTVKYLEQGTEKELHDVKSVTGKTFGETYEETAVDIAGYNPVETKQSITITAGENVLVFYYTARTDLGYTVKYLEQGTEKELHDVKSVTGKTFGETYEETAVDIAGYNPVETKQSITITTGENVLVFYYTARTDLTYTVKYLWTDGNGTGSGTAIEGVQDKVVENVTFGDVIVEGPIDITGYTPVETGKKESRMDAESKVITFLYYKNVTLTAASGSAVYNGTTQTLSGYTSSEAEAKFEGVTASGSGKDVGEYAVTFNGVSEREQKISKNGRYLLTGTVDGKLTITPREAVITVNNGTKTAGRNDPAFTGTVTGLIGENDLGVVSYVRTNNAEAVGTYADVLTALYTENANYDVRVINGTFVITAANNPNPNPPQPNPNPPQPNPNPPQPQPQPEPEPEVEPEAGPEVKPEVTPEEPQPAAPDAGPVEEIADEETPLAMGGAWALVNLILTVLTVLGSILLLIGYIGKKQKEREDENGNVILNAEGEAETDDIKKKGGWRLASIIPAVAAVIAFILTENMRLPMVLVD